MEVIEAPRVPRTPLEGQLRGLADEMTQLRHKVVRVIELSEAVELVDLDRLVELERRYATLSRLVIATERATGYQLVARAALPAAALMRKAA